MAIIVEEEKKSGNLMLILGWVAVFAVLAAAAYYIFFANPDTVTVIPSGALSTIAPFANITLHPDDVFTGIQGLKSTVTLPSPTGPAPVGRTNPFIAP